VTSAYFVGLAIGGVPVEEWGERLLHEALPAARQHITASGLSLKDNLNRFSSFTEAWLQYLGSKSFDNAILRAGNAISSRNSSAAVMRSSKQFRPAERDALYSSLAISGRKKKHGWAGGDGLDAVIIAYDALLASAGLTRRPSLRIFLSV
jgi:hypothetical protein